MKPVKGKNFQDFAPLLRAHTASTCTVSDSDYQELSSHIALRTATGVAERGVVVGLNPRQTPSHKIVRRARTVLGSLPETLLSLLGLEHLISVVIGCAFSPWCKRCSSAARIRPQRSLPSLPKEGLIALVVASHGVSEITLSEWCELLGAERARRGDSLVSVSDLSPDSSGEPVLKIFSAGEVSAVSGEAERWFSSGGGELIVCHLATRGAPLKEIARLSPLARCESCGDEIAVPTIAELAALPDCSRCRGEGWIENNESRLEACGECDGYGSSSDVARGECGNVTLRHVGCLSFVEVAGLIATGGARCSAEDAQALEFISRSSFADYAICTPMQLLSTQERAQLTMLSAQLSGLSGLLFVGDSIAACGNVGGWGECGGSQLCNVEPTWSLVKSLHQNSSGEELRLARCNRGPLSIDSISFPIGNASVIRASSERAALLLLDEIAQRFKRRRKLAAICSFGGLRECISVDGETDDNPSVLELLGLADDVAEEVSRTQAAKRAGLSKEDLTLGKSSRRCAICDGRGIGDVTESCVACFGSGLSAQVCGVKFGAQCYADALSQTLRKNSELFWMNDVISEVFSALPDEVARQVTPVTRAAELGVETARFLRLYGVLKGLLVAGKGRGAKPLRRRDTLLLLWKPLMLTTSHQEVAFELLNQVLAAGVTVVAAGVPGPLEKWFGSVVDLRACGRSVVDASQDRYFDSRFVRLIFTA